MDFFARQDRARRRTSQLLVWFVLGVAAVVGSVYQAVLLLLSVSRSEDAPSPLHGLWQPDLFVAVAGVTLAVIAFASLYKVLMLREGGEAVARLLGGRIVDPNTDRPLERRLLNIVEEMALASGVPVPGVYVLDSEAGINAFAAGFSPSDAVIGVTRGSLETLNRDELQGVIAHEFSHILNGDMRLNLRLMGWLHGILVVALIGWYILRYGGSSGDKGKGGGRILLFGVALLVIGWVGVFFGRLIKSGVSRQREFLADASAVQFTRQPSGLAGALKKIGGLASGSKLISPAAEQASHMFFGNAMGRPALGLLATHPPLADRIRALEPSFDGVFLPVESRASSVPIKDDAAARPLVGRPEIASLSSPALTARPGLGRTHARTVAPEKVSQRVGTLERERLDLVLHLRREIPDRLATAAREPASAAALVYGLLLADDDSEVRRRQLEHLHGRLAAWEYALVVHLAGELSAIGAVEAERLRLPLVELSIPALRRRSGPQFKELSEHVRALVVADERIQLFEYTLQRLLQRHLAPHFGQREASRVRFYGLGGLSAEVSVLLSGLAYLSPRERQRDAFDTAVAELALPSLGVELVPEERCHLKQVDRALRQLALVSPSLKRRLLDAAAAAVISDRAVTVGEAELLRAICDALDCPMPPFLAS